MSYEPRNEETTTNHHHGSEQAFLSRPVSPLEVEGSEGDSDSLEPTVEPIDRLLPILDTWFYEILAIVFSVACFVSIVGVLVAYNKKPAPSLSYGLTLNAIISILATASKSALIFAIGECIGQLKWVWFYKRRKQLDGMQLFDSASRGPFGSLMVILQHRGKSLVSLGAFITILALAFDPFIQQILTYPIRNTVDVTNSSAAAAQQVTYILPDGSVDEPSSIVFSAQWADNVGDIPTPACPTGNCTWPAFESIGLCRKCEDITASTILECDPISLNTSAEYWHKTQSCSVIPPQGQSESITITYSSTHSDGIPVINKRDDGDLWFDVMFPQHSVWSPFGLGFGPDAIFNNYSYAAEFSITANYTLRSTPQLNVGKDLKIKKVTQCALSLCLQTYNISLLNGVVSSNVISVDYGEIFYIDTTNGSHMSRIGIDFCWKPTHRAPVILTNTTFTNTTSAWVNASEFAFEMPGISTLGNYVGGDAASRLVIRQDSSSKYPGYGEPDPNILKFIKNGLEDTTGKIASSFTRSAMAHSNTTVNGIVFSAKVYVSVNWPWIILPAALMVLSVAFLLRLWKTSLLAVLFHGLDGWTSMDDRHATVSQMERTAHSLESLLLEKY
ncbi:hypothetical protein BDV59DRAFT_196983 [Aspergillus ambiguus]|uniref:DUF3176 domain-containing protein n=1 Tax=Aspergillus ambiguus TaxID=176160 RepID=UPI003CCD22C3